MLHKKKRSIGTPSFFLTTTMLSTCRLLFKSNFLFKAPSFSSSCYLLKNNLSTMSPLVEQTIPEDRTRLAEIQRDNLDIVKTLRSDPEIIEYEAYSHSSKSEKEHSLTISVSL
jgi:hypothetical protein